MPIDVMPPCEEAQIRLHLLSEVERAATAVYAVGRSGPVSLKQLTATCGAFMAAVHEWTTAPVVATEDARRTIVGDDAQ